MAGTLNAQVTGAITGMVYDGSSAAVAGAQITVKAIGTQLERRVPTDSSGRYSVELLSIGAYDIQASAAGFKTAVRKNVGLGAADRLGVDFHLEVGDQVQKIDVTEAVPLVQTESGDVSYTVGTQQITDLSINGRVFLSLAALIPGASRTGPDQIGVGFNSQQSFSVNGLREKYTGVMVDGVRNTDMGSNNTQLTSPGLETLSEVKMLVSNFSSEYSSSGGAAMVLSTRSGTNNFHGAACEYVRSDILNARYYFADSKGPSRFNNFGYRIGGPLFIPHLYNKDRNKTFFFFGQEWRRARNTALLQGATPTAAMRSGDFSAEAARIGLPIIDPLTGQPFPGNQIPEKRLNANAQLLLKNLFPLPNAGGFLNYAGTASAAENFRQELVRVDHNFSDNLRLMVRYIHDSWSQDTPTTLWAGSSFPTIGSLLDVPSRNMVVRLTQVINPKLLNEVTLSHANDYAGIDTQAVKLTGSPLRPAGLTIGRLNPLEPGRADYVPDLSFGGGWGGMSTLFFPMNAQNNYTNISDTATKILRRHTLKFGGEYMLADTPLSSQAYPSVNGSFNFSGSFTNDSMADFMIGQASSYQELSKFIVSKYIFHQLELFVQDDWKVSPRLTVNLGLRYFNIPPRYEDHNNISVFRPSLYDPAKAVKVLPDDTIVPGSGDVYNGILTPAKGGPRSLVQNYPWNFAPRFGFAYDLTGHSKTVVRGGFGIDYYRVEGNSIQTLAGNPPFSSILTVFNPPLDNPSQGSKDALHPISVNSIDEHLKVPSVQNWSLGIQRELNGGTALTVAYVGSHGYNLDRTRQLNYPRPANGLDFPTALNTNTIPIDTLAPYPGYSSITSTETNATSIYHSLQVQVKRKMAAGLVFQAAYTFSKAITTADDLGVTPQNPYNPGGDRGLAAFDRPHVFVVNYVYEVPLFKNAANRALKFALGNWEVSGVTTFQSGHPQNLGLNTPFNGLAGRPDVVGGSSLTYPKTQDQWFNVNAFAAPAFGFYGNAGHNTIRGPGTHTWDVSLFKKFQVREKASMQFRAEAYNVVNHVNFDGLSTAFGNGDFGHVTSARDPRSMQIGLKMEF
jgi:hypothetical protein